MRVFLQSSRTHARVFLQSSRPHWREARRACWAAGGTETQTSACMSKPPRCWGQDSEPGQPRAPSIHRFPLPNTGRWVWARSRSDGQQDSPEEEAVCPGTRGGVSARAWGKGGHGLVSRCRSIWVGGYLGGGWRVTRPTPPPHHCPAEVGHGLGSDCRARAGTL